MSIDHAKKQAKNLRRLLPSFIAKHPNGGSLSDFQELVAQTHGYPSFYAMASALEKKETPAVSLGRLNFEYCGVQSYMKHDGGSEDVAYGEFSTGYQLNNKILWAVSEEFDDACEDEGGLTGDFGDYSKTSLNKLCRLAKTLIEREPGFMEGYAFLIGANVYLKNNAEAIKIGKPVAEAAFRMIDQCTSDNGCQKLYTPYYNLPNRAFHRLVHSLALAYINALKPKEAVDLAKRMVDLWPSDNMGFRFLIEDPTPEEC